MTTDPDRIAALTAQNEALRKALESLLHAVCGETGFAAAVRRVSGTSYPWPALELAEDIARAALSLPGGRDDVLQ